MKANQLKNAPEWLKDCVFENEDLDIVNGVVIMQNGTLISGHFSGTANLILMLGGEFSGKWRDGCMNGGTFVDGEWINGTWLTGKWYRGRWIKGLVNGKFTKEPPPSSLPKSSAVNSSVDQIMANGQKEIEKQDGFFAKLFKKKKPKHGLIHHCLTIRD